MITIAMSACGNQGLPKMITAKMKIDVGSASGAAPIIKIHTTTISL